MKIGHNLLKRVKALTLLAVTTTVLTSIGLPALADEHGGRGNRLYVKGYQTYTNVGFIDPANPTLLQVRTGGEGGVAHLGRMRSESSDQTGNLVTGEMLANYMFEDEGGHQLLLHAVGTSAIQPDGRITFAGDLTVTGGTGRFVAASGKLHFDGWARTTDFTTGVGIGFTTIEGVLQGVNVCRDSRFASFDQGVGTISSDGQDFVFEGAGRATTVGKFDNLAQSIPGPFRSAFVGIIDGRFVLSSAYDSVWTTKKGDQIKWSSIEFISFATLTLPDGTPVPDLSKPSTTQIYQTVVDGTGRYTSARGVAFGQGTFEPTGPNTVAARLASTGFFSAKPHRGSDE